MPEYMLYIITPSLLIKDRFDASCFNSNYGVIHHPPIHHFACDHQLSDHSNILPRNIIAKQASQYLSSSCSSPSSSALLLMATVLVADGGGAFTSTTQFPTTRVALQPPRFPATDTSTH